MNIKSLSLNEKFQSFHILILQTLHVYNFICTYTITYTHKYIYTDEHILFFNFQRYQLDSTRAWERKKKKIQLKNLLSFDVLVVVSRLIIWHFAVSFRSLKFSSFFSTYRCSQRLFDNFRDIRQFSCVSILFLDNLNVKIHMLFGKSRMKSRCYSKRRFRSMSEFDSRNFKSRNRFDVDAQRENDVF